MPTDVVEVDALTGERIERDFTPAERAQRDIDIAAQAAAKQAAEAAEAAQVAAQESAITKLAALGLTADEITAVTPAEITVERVEAVVSALTVESLAIQ
jgi:hypothetical protein